MMSVLEDTKPCDRGFGPLALRLRHALPILAVALLMVLLGVLGVLLCPPWSEAARKRRLGIMTALAGDDGP
jgi:hypothetical protein